MRHLLKKELSELLSKQMLIGMVVSFVLIVCLGQVVSSVITTEVTESGTVCVIDLDQTEFTQKVITALEESGYTVKTGTDFKTEAAQNGWTDAVLFPEGMTASLLENHEPCELQSYTQLKSTSAMAMTLAEGGSVNRVEAVIRELLAETYITDELAFLNDPVTVTPITCANGTSVQAEPTMILASMSMFDQFMPLLLFLLVALTSQIIINAIAAEKTDKTLETLLSAPVPRSKIIGAKMLAALIVVLLYVAVYGVAFLIMMLSTVNSAADGMDVGAAFTSLAHTTQAIDTLGLQIPALGWAGVIVQLLLTIGIALTASIILGGMVEDVKGSQMASLPIMVCAIFPYIFSMVSDIRSMEGSVRWLLYCIPFTHTFIATSDLRFHDYALFWGGMAYQATFLGALVFFALRLYSSDMLFVHKIGRHSKQADA